MHANKKIKRPLFKQKQTLNAEVTAIIPPYLGQLCCVESLRFVDNWPNTEYMQQTSTQQEGLMRVDVSSRAKASIVNVRFECYTRGSNERASIVTASRSTTHTQKQKEPVSSHWSCVLNTV